MAGTVCPQPRWNGRAILSPGLASGFFYLLFVLLMVEQYYPGEPWPIELSLADISALLRGVVLLGFVAVVGLALSAVPLLLGILLLAAMGRWNAGTRHPAFWALTGAAMPATMFAFTGSDFRDPPVSALLCTGAACAALARRYVRWPSSEE